MPTFQRLTAKKAIRLGWINPRPIPAAVSQPPQQGQMIPLEPLATQALLEDRPVGVAADGDT